MAVAVWGEAPACCTLGVGCGCKIYISSQLCKSQRPHTSLAGHPREHLCFRCYEGSKGLCCLVASSADDFALVFVVPWSLEKAGCFQCTKEVHLDELID